MFYRRTTRYSFSRLIVASLICLTIFPFSGAQVTNESDDESCGIELDGTCKERECFVMLEEAPYIIYKPQKNSTKDLRKGYSCKQYKEEGMDGISLRLMEDFWKGDTSTAGRCYLGRHTCGFTNMIDWMEKKGGAQYKLVFLGALMETPDRRSRDLQASASIVDSELVIVKRKASERRNAGFSEAFVLMKPFDPWVWGAAFLTLLACVIAAALLTCSKPFKVDTRTRGFRRGIRDLVHDGMQTVSRALVVVFRIGNWGEERENWAAEDYNARNSSSLMARDEGGSYRMSCRVGVYKLTKLILSLMTAIFFGIFILFYNAALTNFLFQESQDKLDRQVTRLTDAELKNYTVLKASAVAETWKKIQQENTQGAEPWNTCDTINECLEHVGNFDSEYLVIQREIAQYKATSESLCSNFSVFVPKEQSYKFNAGFLYGPNVTVRVKKDIDYQLLSDRMSGKIQSITEKFLPSTTCLGEAESNSITWRVFIVPTSIVLCVLFVVILVEIGLICSSLVERSQRLRP